MSAIEIIHDSVVLQKTDAIANPQFCQSTPPLVGRVAAMWYNSHMRIIYMLLVLCALGAQTAFSLTVTFPGEKQKLPHTERCHVIGGSETNANARLYLNGIEIERYHTGAFLAMVRTHEGENTLRFEQGTNVLTRIFTVLPPEKSVPSPSSPPRDVYADLGIASNAVVRAHPPKGAQPGDVLVVVDAGHGGNDSGARTPRGFREKDYNLRQTKAIADALRQFGFKVVETRADDSFPPLYARPKRAIAQNADLFISVHHNATGAGGNPREARHTVAYASNDLGLPLAAAIQKHVGRAMAPVKDLGAQMKSLAVCRNPVIPSCLLEIDFINLPEGEFESDDSVRREKVAQAVVLGILDWLALAE